MNIRFIVTHLSHESPGSFYRPYEMAKHLTKHNVTSKILTPSEEDVKNIKDVTMIALPNIGQKLGISNFVYETIRKVIYNKKFGQFIAYDKLLVSLSERIAIGIEKSLDLTPDILQGEQEVAALASIKIAKKLGISVVVDIHNIWPEELVSTGHLKRESDTFKNLMNLERFIVENADNVIVVNEFMRDYVVSNFNAERKKLTLIPPGGEVIYQNYDELDKERFMHKKVVYAGLVNPREHVDLLIKSMPFVSSRYPDVKLIVAEKGETVNEIKTLSKSLSVNPEFYWFESREESRTMLKKCYIATLPSKDNVGRKLGTPLKLLEYMSNGLPVVANDIGSWCNIIREEKIGILTKDDPKDFADGICMLLEDEKMYKTMQNNMIKLLHEKFSWAIHVEKILLPMYRSLLS